MARFSFRLERVLSVRRHEEDHEKLVFGAAVQKRHEASTHLDEIEKRIGEVLGETPGETTTLDQLVISYEYRISLLSQKEKAAALLKKRNVELEEARLSLIAARRRRRALELLRENQFKLWKTEQETIEQNEIEEIALQNHARMGAESGGLTSALGAL